MSRGSTIWRIASFCAVFVVAAAAWAQSPFQSAPGPAPPPVARPAPRPAPRPRQQEELAPTETTIPAPAPQPVAPPPPPPPPPLPSLAGTWHLQSDCPLDFGTDIEIRANGGEQYAISGGNPLTPVAGWISSKLVHFEAQALINHVVFEGSVETANALRGKVTQSLGITCTWVALKK